MLLVFGIFALFSLLYIYTHTHTHIHVHPEKYTVMNK